MKKKTKMKQFDNVMFLLREAAAADIKVHPDHCVYHALDRLLTGEFLLIRMNDAVMYWVIDHLYETGPVLYIGLNFPEFCM